MPLKSIGDALHSRWARISPSYAVPKTASAGQLQFSQIFCPLQSALAILTVRTETLFITPTRFERVLWLNSPSFEQASTSPISVNPDWGIIFGVRATSTGGFSMSGIETKELCGVL